MGGSRGCRPYKMARYSKQQVRNTGSLQHALFFPLSAMEVYQKNIAISFLDEELESD